MGGTLPLYAAAYPQRVRSLWLLGPSGALSGTPSDLQRHLPMIEAPETVAADYLAFLSSLTSH